MEKIKIALIASVLVAIVFGAGMFVSLANSFLMTSSVNPQIVFHMTVSQYRNGILISQTYHAMTNTLLGLNWTMIKLTGIDDSSTWGYNATYIACSNNTGAVSTAWTSIPDERTTDGLSRAAATMVYNLAAGAWNATVSFSVSGTNATCLYGYYYGSGVTATLIAAEQQGAGAMKNVVAGDTLVVRIQGQTA